MKSIPIFFILKYYFHFSIIQLNGFDLEKLKYYNFMILVLIFQLCFLVIILFKNLFINIILLYFPPYF